MGNNNQEAPLKGYRVIDFGQYIAGPAAAMILAEQGAEVIRVDPKTGPFWDSPTMHVLNRDKKSIALDLKQDDDKEIAKRLIASADVVIENFLPGVMKRLGLGANAMTQINPKLIYLSLPGFSSEDEERNQLPGWEGIIAAATGWFKDMGINRMLTGAEVSYSALPLSSIYGALLGVLSVTVSLYKREYTGKGEIIEVPLAAAISEGLAYNTMFIENLPERYKSLPEREFERRRIANEPMNVNQAELEELLDPFYRNYRCADDRDFYLCCLSHKTQPIKTLKILGLWEDMVKEGIPLVDPYLSTREWPEGVDCTLLATPLSIEWTALISKRMEEAFSQKPSFEWEQTFGKNRIPGAAQRTTKEWLHSEHALSSGLITELNDSIYGRMKQPGNIVWFENGCLSDKTPASSLDEDREEILASLNSKKREARESQSLTVDELPLQGLRIVDLTNVIAGPTIAGTLRRFGAEVIKVDPASPTLDPTDTIIYGFHANRGKRSALIDLKTSEGQKIFKELLKDIDVLTFNGLDAQLAPLGIDPAQLQEDNPNLILCRIDAYGGPHLAQRSEIPGYDETIQASTGVMSRFGGSINTPEMHASLGTIDVLAGFCGAFAVAVALMHRYRGGSERVVRTSLAAAGQLIQVPFMYDYEGRAPFNEPSGRGVKGEHALHRLYKSSDDWFFLAVPMEMVNRLADIQEFAEIESVAQEDFESYMEEQFQLHPVDYWVKQLIKHGFAAYKVDNLADVRANHLYAENTQAFENETTTILFLSHDSHPSGRRVDLVAPNAIRFKHSRIMMPGSAPRFGKHTRQILKELGFRDQQIDQWITEQIVSESWTYHGEYLPD